MGLADTEQGERLIVAAVREAVAAAAATTPNAHPEWVHLEAHKAALDALAARDEHVGTIGDREALHVAWGAAYGVAWALGTW